MGRHTNPTKKATVSVNHFGVFVGVKARKALGVRYNDEVRIKFPDVGISVSGELNSAHRISVKSEIREILKENGEHSQGQTWHIDAVVEKTGGSWYDGRDVDEERYNRVSHITLPASN